MQGIVRNNPCHAVECPDPHHLATIASAQQRYARHRPEESLLYQTVEQHAERDVSLPGFVRKEFEAYLRCWRLEHG